MTLREEAWRKQEARGRGGRRGRWEGSTGAGPKRRGDDAVARSSEAAVEVRNNHLELLVERSGVGVGCFLTDGEVIEEKIASPSSMY